MTRTGAATREAPLRLPNVGPDLIPLDTSWAAVLGLRPETRPSRFRSFGVPQGRWVWVPAFGWSRFDTRPVKSAGDLDILVAEGLHGRLDRAGWHDVHDAQARVRPSADAAADRAGGWSFWELSADEVSVLGEPGTVGALLREIGRTSGIHPGHVAVALPDRRPPSSRT